MTHGRSYCPLCRAIYDDPEWGFCTVDGARLHPWSECGAGWVGREIQGKYRVTAFLGAGAMAEVYEAEHLLLARNVAIKLMQPQLAVDATAVERFKREARLISLIAHPNVVALEDFGVLDDGTLYMVMERLRGRSIEEALADGALDPGLAIEVGVQACEGLQAAHDHQIVHRDVKSSNIFLHELGSAGSAAVKTMVKILDLGVAKVIGDKVETTLTAVGLIFGTPQYMSPEQAQGEPVDARSDVYSLGVVLYEMFTGTLPFTGTSYAGILTRQITQQPVWPEELARSRGLPPAAGRLVLKALSKNPRHRFDSMRELAGALGELATGLTAPTDKQSLPVKARQWLSRARPATVRRITLGSSTEPTGHEVVEIAPDVFWVGRREGVVLERNSYLRVYRGNRAQLSVLIDPGPPRDLESVAAKVGAVLGSLKRVDILFLNHQDPDVSANAAVVQELNPRAHVWCSEETWRLVQFYGLKPGSYSAVEHMADLATRFVTGHQVVFVPTPYCHFRGAVAYYDRSSRVLFSGDLFGGLSTTTGLVASEADLNGIDVFHQLYMPAGQALAQAVAAVRALDPAPLIIAPQHGGLIRGELIPAVLGRVERLLVGMEMRAVCADAPAALAAVRDIVAELVEWHGAKRMADELRFFSSDGSFPNLFVLDDTRVVEIKIHPSAAIRALADRMRAVTPAAEHGRLAGILETALRRHQVRLTDPWLERAESAAR